MNEPELETSQKRKIKDTKTTQQSNNHSNNTNGFSRKDNHTASATTTDNTLDHYESSDNTISGSNQIFSKFSFLGFESLTEIQKKAIPVISQKKDCLLVAPTGSGKTEASVIPVFSKISESRTPKKVKAIYVTPLRALNRDVFKRIIRYAENESLSINVYHGDTPQKVRRMIADSPPDILITTPESLLVLLSSKRMLSAISELEWIIIDEVHEILSNERGSQLSLSLERLQLNTKHDMTRVGLSATVGNLEEAAKFVVGAKRKCSILKDNSVRNYDVDVKYIDGSVADVADYVLDFVQKNHSTGPVLLFANTRSESEYLASVMREKTNQSLPVELHHGSLSAGVREETEDILRQGRPGIVVCTSSLELGIDIGSVELVIHYGSPRQVSKLIQRIGRSRHKRESSAKGLIVTNNADDEFEALAILERVKEQSIEEQKIHFDSFDVLAHHVIGITMQLGAVTIEKILKTVNHSFPFKDVTLEQLVEIVEILESLSLVYYDREEMSVNRRGRAIRYHYQNLSTIPDILRFKVFDTTSKKVIGTLDQRFVGDNGDPGNVFVLRGMQWRILNVDEKSFKVNVERLMSAGVNVPYWEGENIPVDYDTASRVGKLRRQALTGQIQVSNKVLFNDKPNAAQPASEKNNQQEDNSNSLVADESTILVESMTGRNRVVLHCCFGTKINSTLSTLLSSMISARTGYLVDSRSDAYRIVLSSSGRIHKKDLLEVLDDEYDLEEIVRASLSGTHNVNWRTWCVSKKFGMVGRESVYDKKTARFLYERYKDTPIANEALRELFHDKYDLDGAKKILDKIRKGMVKISWGEVDRFSKLSEPILDHATKYYSSPASMDKGILDMVKNRLLKTKHRLICARCGKWENLVETNQVVNKTALFCKYCRSRQITATFSSDYDLPKIIQKKRLGKKLAPEEDARYKRAWKVSSLIENFGPKALVVLSGYGVGADTAARILRNMVSPIQSFSMDEPVATAQTGSAAISQTGPPSSSSTRYYQSKNEQNIQQEDDDNESLLLYKQIYEAERQYVITRGFWD